MKVLKFKKTGTFSRIPDDTTDLTTRVTVAVVRCSEVYAPVSTVYGTAKQWQERANWAQLAAGKVVYTEVPSEEIDADMRFTIDSKEYQIRDISGWPDNDPQFYEIFIEAETG